MRMEEPLMDGWGPRGTLRHVSDRCGGAGEPADDGEGPTLIRYIQGNHFMRLRRTIALIVSL